VATKRWDCCRILKTLFDAGTYYITWGGVLMILPIVGWMVAHVVTPTRPLEITEEHTHNCRDANMQYTKFSRILHKNIFSACYRVPWASREIYPYDRTCTRRSSSARSGTEQLQHAYHDIVFCALEMLQGFD
jgi:hypothetical protein